MARKGDESDRSRQTDGLRQLRSPAFPQGSSSAGSDPAPDVERGVERRGGVLVSSWFGRWAGPGTRAKFGETQRAPLLGAPDQPRKPLTQGIHLIEEVVRHDRRRIPTPRHPLPPRRLDLTSQRRHVGAVQIVQIRRKLEPMPLAVEHGGRSYARWKRRTRSGRTARGRQPVRGPEGRVPAASKRRFNIMMSSSLEVAVGAWPLAEARTRVQGRSRRSKPRCVSLE